jgi:hypothetical protein
LEDEIASSNDLLNSISAIVNIKTRVRTSQ